MVRRRIAVAAVASGILFTGGEASVAITALSGPTGDAAQAVFPPEIDARDNQGGKGSSHRDVGVLGRPEAEDANTLQPAGQVAATSESDQLPLTGLVAIPLLLLGATVLVVGTAALRRLQQPPII